MTRNRKPGPARTGIPMLAGIGVTPIPGLLIEYPAEPIMFFDRHDYGGPRQTLKKKLEQYRWKPDVIEDFLDRLGFKT